MESLPRDSTLHRYREIVADWDGFIEAALTPPDPVFRVNTLLADPAIVAARLRRQGFAVTALPWGGLYRCRQDGLGRTLEHWLGWFYLQEATQCLPVLALAPRPGDRALDLCASPGGKASQMAAWMENEGTLVVNEPIGRRHPALLANLNRLGVLNAIVCAYRGESFPGAGGYDRVLVDAPCSAEGTLRKDPSARRGASRRTIDRLAALQQRLIVRGFDLLRHGGVLVYSTCTLAPEENEAVIAHLVEVRDAVVDPLQLPVPTDPGLTAWNGITFPRSIARCVRIYPHHIDSGGGFLARLSRA
jgi:NOL1/NOP2/sun family putative RNA methylase